MAEKQADEDLVSEPSPSELRMGRRTSAAKHELAGHATEVQKRTFTRWVNAQLVRGKADVKVNDLFTDLRSGVILQKLVAVLAPGASLRREKGKARVHRISNMNAVLQFLRNEAKIKLVNIDAEDLVEGKEKLTLGLIWSLIQHYQLGAQEGSGQTSLEQKKALLAWCQQCVNDYRGVKVTDLSKSWRDGLAFNALLHYHKEDVVDFDSLSAGNAEENLQGAFDKAEQHFNVPQLLDPADVNVKSPDERSIMTYLVLVKNELQPLKHTPVPSPEPADKTDGASDELLQWISQRKELTEQRQSAIPVGDVLAIQSCLGEINGEQGEVDKKEDEVSSSVSDGAEEAFGDLIDHLSAYRAALKEALAGAKTANENRERLGKSASDLASWAQERGQKFQQRNNLPDEWSALCLLKKELDNHVDEQRPSRETEKSEVAALFESVMSSPAVSGNADVLKSVEEDKNTLEQAWARMADEQPLYAAALDEKIEAARQDAIQKLDARHAAFTEWVALVSQPLSAELPSSIAELQQLQEDFKKQEAGDMVEHESQLENLLDDTKQLGLNGILDGQGASDRYKAQENRWSELKVERDQYWKQLSEALAAAQQAQDASARADQLREWMQQRTVVFSATDFPTDVESLRTLSAQHQSQYLETELPLREGERSNVVTALEQSESTECTVSRQSLLQDWQALQDNEKRYAAALNSALEAAAAAEAKEKAALSEFVEWANQKCFEFTSAQEQISSGSHSLSLEQQLANLDQYEAGEKQQRRKSFETLMQRPALPATTALRSQASDSWKRVNEEEASYRSLLHTAISKAKQAKADEADRLAQLLSGLDSWIVRKLSDFSANGLENCSKGELEQRLQTFDNSYVVSELPPRKAEFDQVSATAGKALADRWGSLEVQQTAYRAALIAAIADRAQVLSDLEHFVREHTAQCGNHNFTGDLASLTQLYSAGERFGSHTLKAKEDQLAQFAVVCPQDAASLQSAMANLRNNAYPEYMVALQEALNAAKAAAGLQQWIAGEQAVFRTDLTGKKRSELNDLRQRVSQHEAELAAKENLLNSLGGAGTGLNPQWNEMNASRESFKRALEEAIAADDARKAEEDEEVGPSVVPPLVTSNEPEESRPPPLDLGSAVVPETSGPDNDGESTPLLGSPRSGSPTRRTSSGEGGQKKKGCCSCCVIL